MAILFYEGLPRSGKSYESMSTLVIPWLQKGREVVAYIEGLETVECQQRIAEASGLALEVVRKLLFPLTREDMRPREVEKGGKTVQVDGAWIEKTRDNALHVFDEAQNWWPNRLKATEGLTQFVTEHGHRGITVLLMGQSLLDVLALWRRRVDQKFIFLKLTALGSDKRYRVTIHKGQGNGEFVKVSDKLGKYDPKYFGTYKSHVSGEIDTDTYTDNRAVFWKGGMVKYGAVVSVGLLIWGSMSVWAFFHPKSPAPAVAAAPVSSVQQTSANAQQGVQTPPVKAASSAELKSPQERYFAELGDKGRIRLSGLLVGRGRVAGVVEWLDGNTRVIERQSLDTLRDLGVAVLVTGPTVRLTLGEWSTMATMWPVEAEGKVSEYRQAVIRGAADGSGTASHEARGGDASASAVPSGLTVIDVPRREPAAPLVQQPERAAPRVQPGSKWSFQTGA